MKRSYLFLFSLLLSSGVAFAQGEMDAYRLSQSEISGTARYMSMGGAFGALGGDISVMNNNPAGLGVYRSSEVVTTLNLSMFNTQSNWNNSKVDRDKTKFTFNNIAYVSYFPTGNDSGVLGWNFGFSYNRSKNFSRNYRLSGTQAASMADYVASRASNTYMDENGDIYGIDEQYLIPSKDDEFSPYHNNAIPGQWLPVLGYNAGFMGIMDDRYSDVYQSAFGERSANGTWNTFSPQLSTLDVREKGAVDDYTFSFATNISNIVYIGASFIVTDLDYSIRTVYDEDFGTYGGAQRSDHLYLDNYLSTDGTAYGFNIGAIVAPVDFLRLGVAYNSPKWYKMTDHYYAEAGTYLYGYEQPEANYTTPDDGDYFTDYKLRTPDRWIFSAAGIIGTQALISVDYELQNYKNMRLKDRDGYSYGDNDFIKEDFGIAHTIRVGAEYKVTPQFAVRLGGAWQTSPMKSHLKNGDTEVLTAGTLPHFTVDDGVVSNYSVGFGYRFTPQFYMDIACVYRIQKENAYAFSSTFGPTNHTVPVESIPASLKTKTTKVALTLGYKF